MNSLNELNGLRLMVLNDTDEVFEMSFAMRGLGGVEKMLKAAASGAWSTVPAVARVGGSVLNVSSRQGEVVVAGSVDILRIKTYWAGQRDKAWPVWVEGEEHFETTRQWTPHGGMRLWFLVVADKSAASVNWKLSMFVAEEVDENGKGKGFYRLPLGNLNTECSVCHGDGRARMRDCTDLISMWDTAWTIFNEASFNHHLLHDTKPEDSKAVFAFNIRNETPVRTTPWTQHCQKVSSAYFAGLE